MNRDSTSIRKAGFSIASGLVLILGLWVVYRLAGVPTRLPDVQELDRHTPAVGPTSPEIPRSPGTVTPEWTATPIELTRPPFSNTPEHTAAPSATGLTRPTPTSTGIPAPTSSRAQTATPTTVTTPAVPLRAPVLVEPSKGVEIKGTVVKFSWSGQLGLGQFFRLRLRHVDTALIVESERLSDTSWTVTLPAEQFGAWEWNAQIIRGNVPLIDSETWHFYLNPFGGGG